MAQKTGKVSNKVMIFAVISVFIIIFVLIWQFNSFVGDEFYDAVENELGSMVAQQKIIIRNENESNMEFLCLMADLIEDEEIESDEISEFLCSRIDRTELSEIYYIDIDGQGYSDSGELVDFSGNAVFRAVIEQGEPSAGMNEHSTLANGIMDLAAPVFDNGEVVGAVLGVNSVSALFTELSAFVSDKGYVLIVDDHGEAMVSSTEDYINIERLAMDDVEFYYDTSLDDVYANLGAGMSGSVYFGFDGVEMVAYFDSLDFGGLNLVIAVEQQSLQTGMHQIVETIAYMSVTFLVFYVLIVALGLWNRRAGIVQVERAAYYDELTQLPNLTKLKRDMNIVLSKHKDKKYAIIKVDVENFKAINEIYGFEIGNRVLRAFKQISDSVPVESLIVARIGTDEFIFFAGDNFLEELDSKTSGYEANFKIIIPELENHHLAFRYGRYFIELGETNVDDIITKVSFAHTMAKEKKEQIIWDYDDTYKEHLLKMAVITNKMEKAMQNEEFCVYLQPKVNLTTGELIGAEALVRWIEPDGNMIYPDSFIPLFESNGFIIELDKFVLGCVCRLFRSWLDEGKSCVPISVNFSRLHLGNLNFVGDITEIVSKHGIPHELIEVEMTETTLLENEVLLRNLIEELHKENYTISIDDFGAGYSSLGMLKEYRTDVIKLDRSFIAHSNESERGELVIDGIVKLAHSLNMRIVAEGVEEESQAEFLKSIKCEAAQGYLFARPMPIMEFEEKFMKDR